MKCEKCGLEYVPEELVCAACDNILSLPGKKGAADARALYAGVNAFGRHLGVDEKALMYGSANYYTGSLTNAGGKMLLTEASLSFSAHMLNVGRAYCSIDLRDITDVRLSQNVILSQIIDVVTERETHRFAVNHGEKWVQRIRSAAGLDKKQ